MTTDSLDVGQLVRVRGEQWVVSEVSTSALRTDELAAAALPGVSEAERWGDPHTHSPALIDAVRWGTVASADVSSQQAPFRSGIQIRDHQLEPVAKALRMPRVALLIGDDVARERHLWRALC